MHSGCLCFRSFSAERHEVWVRIFPPLPCAACGRLNQRDRRWTRWRRAPMNKPRGRPFQPGNSAGKGRPMGSRNKLTMAAKRLLEEHSESIVRKCVIAALQGDRQALLLCMERVLPARRDAPIRTKLASVKTAGDVDAALQAVLNDIEPGRTTPSEG